MEPVLFPEWRGNPRGRWRGRCVSIGRSGLTKWVSASGKPEGPGEFTPNPSSFDIARWKDIGLVKSLDLVPNSLRQNGSIWTSFALVLLSHKIRGFALGNDVLA
jgi:hypothetical protein